MSLGIISGLTGTFSSIVTRNCNFPSTAKFNSLNCDYVKCGDVYVAKNFCSSFYTNFINGVTMLCPEISGTYIYSQSIFRKTLKMKPEMWTWPRHIPMKPHRKAPHGRALFHQPTRFMTENSGSTDWAQILRWSCMAPGLRPSQSRCPKPWLALRPSGKPESAKSARATSAPAFSTMMACPNSGGVAAPEILASATKTQTLIPGLGVPTPDRHTDPRPRNCSAYDMGHDEVPSFVPFPLNVVGPQVAEQRTDDNRRDHGNR